MKFSARRPTLALATVIFAMTCAVSSNALCGAKTRPAFHPQSWQGVNSLPSLLPVADEPSIVGMWHVAFTAKGNGADGPPDGAAIDNALVTWHADGTEIMNSGRPPQDGQFCMGVWERTGALKYKLNHFAWAGNDTENPGGIGNPAGPTHIVEEISLCPGGNQFEGTFTLDAYDTKGNVTAHIVGVVKGVRITVNTTVKELL